MQAEKHRSALPTGPIQALSQDTSSRSTSHDREATGAADSNGPVRQLDSPFIQKRVFACTPVYRARRGSSCAKRPLLCARDCELCARVINHFSDVCVRREYGVAGERPTTSCIL